MTGIELLCLFTSFFGYALCSVLLHLLVIDIFEHSRVKFNQRVGCPRGLDSKEIIAVLWHQDPGVPHEKLTGHCLAVFSICEMTPLESRS